MTQAEFFKQLNEKILLNDMDGVSTLLEEYYWHWRKFYERYNFTRNLTQYLNKRNYHLLPKQMNNFWDIASFYQDIKLINNLLKIQDGKYSYENLISLLKSGFYHGFDHIFNLINEYPNSYKYEPDDKLYRLLELIMDRSTLPQEKQEKTKDTLYYFLNTLKSSPTFQRDLNQLTYKALAKHPRGETVDMLNILIDFGADPFANYYEGDVDTGVPIVFKAIQIDTTYIQPLLQSTVELRNWNIIDEWGRNLLHYATNDEETYKMLLAKGVDPDHRALISNQAKAVIAKMNGSLPKEYGKTPQELLKSLS